MSAETHGPWADAAGAYVLGAMPAEEREEFEAHLATCPACRQEVEDLQPAAEALPMASPPMRPPAALKDRIMAEVEREASLLAQAGAAADRPADVPRRRRLPRFGLWRLAPVAAALAIVAVLIGGQLGGSGKDVQFDRAGATLKIDGDRATLVADNLPAPPQGRVYEVWVQKGGKVQPTDALFVPRSDGSVEAAVPGDASQFQKVMVSDEPPGGSDAPTGKVLMQADVS